MEWVETTGRTVEEAKRSALEKLGVEETDAEFEVVNEPRIGLFGRLKEEARVRARLQPRYPRSKGERRERRRPRGAAAKASTATDKPSSDKPSSSSPRRDSQRRPKAGSSNPDDATAAEHPAPSSTGSRRRNTKVNTPPSLEGASVAGVVTETAEQEARAAEEFLRGFVDRLGVDASVSSESRLDGFLELDISGDGLGLLIGPRGTTLLALQEITRTVVQRRFPFSETRLVVDVNGYRKRRHEALARFAAQLAQEVATTNRRRALEPMPAADRKVVHDVVNSVPGVTTISEGEEPNRRVVLIPTQDSPAKPQLGQLLQEGKEPGAWTPAQPDRAVPEAPGADGAPGQTAGSQQ